MSPSSTERTAPAPAKDAVAELRRRLDQVERAVELTVSWQYQLRVRADEVRDATRDDRFDAIRAAVTQMEHGVEALRRQLQDMTQILADRGFLQQEQPLVPPPPSEVLPAVATTAPQAPPPTASPLPPVPSHRERRILTSARWGRVVADGDGHEMHAIADKYPDGAEAVFRVHRRDVEVPLGTVEALVRNDRVMGVWEHGDLESMLDAESDDVELYFEVEVGNRTTRSKVVTRGSWLAHGTAARDSGRGAEPVQALAACRWSTDDARPGEPVDLYALVAGFLDGTAAELEIRRVGEVEPITTIETFVENEDMHATWQVPEEIETDSELEFVVRIGHLKSTSDRMHVGGGEGRRREARGRRADDRPERASEPDAALDLDRTTPFIKPPEPDRTTPFIKPHDLDRTTPFITPPDPKKKK